MSKRIFSGAQPTGNLHIGNYLGALRNWVGLQHEYESFFCIVNLHAITVPQDPARLAAKTLEVARIYLASGIDPRVSTVFVQSDVAEHSELAWVLNCVSRISELERMTQYKDKAKKQREDVRTGLLTYPALMAADILLYQTDLVPVGHDQKQHLELTRDLAERFNRDYGETFRLPEPFIPKVGAKIMSLFDVTKKMSKSEQHWGASIELLDDADLIKRKYKSAVTDLGREIRFDEAKPAITNLLTIYQLLTGKQPAEIEEHFEGKGYAQLKSELADVTIEFLRPFQERVHAISDEYLSMTLSEGAEKARAVARETMRLVYERMGIMWQTRVGKRTESDNVIPHLDEEVLDKFRDDACVWVILDNADPDNRYLLFPKDKNTLALWAFLGRRDAELLVEQLKILPAFEELELIVVADSLREIRKGAKENSCEVFVMSPNAPRGFLNRQKEVIRQYLELHNPAW